MSSSEGETHGDDIVVVNKAIQMKDTTTEGAYVPVELIQMQPWASEELKTSAQIVIKHAMASFGFTETISVVKPHHVALFLAAHMMTILGKQNLFRRLFKKDVKREVAKNPSWRDVTNVRGSVMFDPVFWAKLFSEMRCDMSTTIMERSRYISKIVMIAAEHGIDCSRSILPVFMLRYLTTKNAMALAHDPRFAACVYGVGKTTVSESDRINMLSDFVVKMTNFDWQPVLEEQNAAVIVLCSSTFRDVPLFKHNYDTGTIPVIFTPRSDEGENVDADADGDGCCGVGEDMPGLVDIAKLPSVPDSKDEIEDDTLPQLIKISNHEEEEKPNKQPPRLFEPYPSKVHDMEELLRILSSTKRHHVPTKAQLRLVNEVFHKDHKSLFSTVVSKYSEKMAFPEITDSWITMQSMLICLFGGNDWVDIHDRFVVAGKIDKQYRDVIGARNVVQNIDATSMAMILNDVIDASNVESMPQDIVSMISKLGMLLNQYMDAVHREKFDVDAPKYALAIYWDSSVPSGNELALKFKTVDLWREMGWYSDQQMFADIDTKWKTKYGEMLPTPLRALVLATFL